MTGLPTTQQERAKHAWDTVTEARKKFAGAAWDEFDGHVKRLGPRIVIAGLGPAVAFVAAKEAPDYCPTSLILGWISESIAPETPEVHRDRETDCRKEVRREAQR
jgi:hypothetical protein